MTNVRVPGLSGSRDADDSGLARPGRRIEILPDHVANQIAAGEVVERPASAVKELVENSIDAGATLVSVELRGGGKSEIRVSDDGTGMERGDALLALDRHATSKIRSADDLRIVRSFGFRGEALPSIAAVSRFEMHTATEPADGVRVRVDFGRVRSVTDVPRQRGTTVSVKGLFHDLPARAKFLRTAGAETRAVSEALVLLALANPDVGFRLASNGRNLLRLDPGDELLARIGHLWGDLAATLIPIERIDDGIRISGYVQRPDAAGGRGGRRYTFVNGRPFRDPSLLRVVDDAFRTTIIEGLRPSLFLEFAVDPAAVDVNVHPAKAEVRFRDRKRVEEALHACVRQALARLDSTRPLGDDPVPQPATPSGNGVGQGTSSRRSPREPQEPSPDAASRGMPQLALFVAGRDPDGPDEPGEADEDAGEREERSVHFGAAFTEPDLWQLHDRYILAETREGLLIIDQHSAHERVLYEEIMARFAHGGGTAQALLFPATLQFSPTEAAAVDDLLGLLTRLGFELEPFGERTYILRASPQPHARFDAERCLREMIQELTEGSPLVDSARNQHERIAKSMACKGAVKAGERLAPEEARELFDRLFATELPGHDVHGRPTIVRLTVSELDRRFGRG